MFKDRIFPVILFIFLLIFIQTFTIFNLQFFENRFYKTLSENNIYKKRIVPAVRGNIITSDSVIVATSRKYFTISADIKRLDIEAENILKIAQILDIEPESLNFLIGEALKNKETEICLKNNLDIKTVSYFEENKNKFPEFEIRFQPKRFYPFNKLYTHITGYVGRITGDEYGELKIKGYSIDDFVGKTGVEKFYEEFLKGRNGVEYYEVDVYGNIVRQVEQKNSVKKINGNDVYISVNHKIEVYIDSLFSEFQSGCAIALNVKDGSVVAFYSKPSFDPNIFLLGLRKEQWDYLKNDILSPFLNRCTNGLYPPGSVFKIVTFLSGLNEGKADSNTFFQPCFGGIIISNKMYKCWNVHNELNLFDAFVRSCDVYFYQLGIKIGLDDICKTAYELGFGELTGIDINEESRGLIPDSKFMNKKYGKNMWGVGQVANVSIGQGDILVTPIQVVNLLVALSNSGKFLKPQIVDSIKSKKNDIIYRKKVTYTKEMKIKKEFINLLRKAMYNVVNSSNGTGTLARIDKKYGFISGKTGTAENSSGEPHAWFASIYSGIDGEDELAMVVIIENGGHGGDDPALITKKIVERYVKIKYGF